MHNVLKHHPPGLYILFATEMWERFSFYGMRALLVLYLTKDVGLARADALEVYATYTALVYLTPLLGGYLTDRYLGQHRAVIIGGILMALGHFAMAAPQLLYPAMGLLILGNGFFKPNISALVGELYEKEDRRRDGAYTIFYMGINLGAFAAPLVCGTLGEGIGWHWGFGAAGVGMIVSLVIFVSGQRWLPERRVLSRVASVEYETPLTSEEKARLAVIFAVTAFSVLFWMGFEQAGGTMTLFADEKTDRTVFGISFPVSWFQSINPLAIFLLAPIFAIGWEWLDRTRYKLSAIKKEAVGLFCLAAGFILMGAADAAGETGPVSPLWLVGVYVIHTAGELCVSPVGLSLVNRLAPRQFASLMMAVWFTSSFIANYLAGMSEAMLAWSGVGINLWHFLTVTSSAGGALLLLLSPRLERMAASTAKPLG